MANRNTHLVVLLVSSYGACPGAEKSQTAYKKGVMYVKSGCQGQRAQHKPRADGSKKAAQRIA